MTNPISQGQFYAVLGATLRNIAAVIIAFGVVMGAGWYAVEPRVTAWLALQFSGFTEQLSSLDRKVVAIERKVGADKVDFIEFQGNGVIVTKGPFAPGQVIEILYQLRRNINCPTLIERRYMAASRGRMAAQYTDVINGTQADATISFRPIIIPVPLPKNMDTDRYSYMPILSPDQTTCPGQRSINVPPSEFFDVVKEP